MTLTRLRAAIVDRLVRERDTINTYRETQHPQELEILNNARGAVEALSDVLHCIDMKSTYRLERM